MRYVKLAFILALALIPIPVAELFNRTVLRRRRAVAERVVPRP